MRSHRSSHASPAPDLRLLLVLGVTLAAVLLPMQQASAACHSFMISVSPASVAEGATVTVTVERDGNVGSSSVHVRTVDGTAKAGSDYPGVNDRTITFTTETSQTFPVNTTNDAAAENAETFRVALVEGSGAGCANTAYEYGPPATVTITANDQPAPTTPPPTTASNTPSPTRRPSSTPTRTTPPAATSTPASSAPPSGSPSASDSPTETDSPTPTFAAGPPVGDGDDGGSSAPWVVVTLVAAAAAAAGGTYLLRRGRSGAG